MSEWNLTADGTEDSVEPLQRGGDLPVPNVGTQQPLVIDSSSFSIP